MDKTLCGEWSDREFSLALAEGLCELLLMQDYQEGTATLNSLKDIADNWPGDRGIALMHAVGLFCMSLIQLSAEKDPTESLNQLQAIGDRFPTGDAVQLGCKALQLATTAYRLEEEQLGLDTLEQFQNIFESLETPQDNRE